VPERHEVEPAGRPGDDDIQSAAADVEIAGLDGRSDRGGAGPRLVERDLEALVLEEAEVLGRPQAGVGRDADDADRERGRRRRSR
jgi:hypothetical protein